MSRQILLPFILASCIIALTAATSQADREEEEKGCIYTPGRRLSVPEGAFPADASKGGLLIARFRSEPSEDTLKLLRRKGIEVLGYLGDDTYWIRLVPGLESKAIPGVRAAIRPTAEDKITPALAKRMSAAGGRQLPVTVNFFPKVDMESIRRLLGTIGAEAPPEGLLYGSRLHLKLAPADIKSLAASEIVNELEPGGRRKKTLNRKASRQTRSLEARELFDIDGDGVALAQWDAGRVYKHREFDDRLRNVGKKAISDHSTHVAGTMVAAGKKPLVQGHAPAGRIIAYDFFGNVVNEMEAAGSKYGIVISNNSWGYVSGWEFFYLDKKYGYIWGWFGDDFFGYYSSEAAALDRLIYKQNLIVVFAAGNDRGDIVATDFYWDDIKGRLVKKLVVDKDGPYMTVGDVASAKNVFTLGATSGGRKMSSFSSFGPTRDGRVKPEVTAPLRRDVGHQHGRPGGLGWARSPCRAVAPIQLREPAGRRPPRRGGGDGRRPRQARSRLQVRLRGAEHRAGRPLDRLGERGHPRAADYRRNSRLPRKGGRKN